MSDCQIEAACCTADRHILSAMPTPTYAPANQPSHDSPGNVQPTAGQVERHLTRSGRRIYRIPIEVFPQFYGNAYLICGGSHRILVDCGSGQRSSNAALDKGLATIRDEFGEDVSWKDLGTVLITHGHIDHIGGLNWLLERTDATLGIHVLDRRILSNYEERMVVASAQVEIFLEGSGVSPERSTQYLEMYRMMKQLFQSRPADFWFEEGPLLNGELEAFHVPGHCPGQVCLQVDDVLLTADHLLPDITPHLSPEVITLNTGVGHYLDSLRKIETLTDIQLGLGGHGGPIADIHRRIEEIRESHARRHTLVLETCATPKSVREISRRIFGPVRSYHILLAILEAGAHVEYLYQRGELIAVNLDEIEAEPHPVIRYRRA